MRKVQGLNQEQVKIAAEKYGSNRLSEKKRKTFWDTFWGNFDDPIIIVLLIALGINIIFTFFGKVDWHECIGILCSILIATFVSSLSEFKNESTFQHLQEEANNVICKVYRSGELKEISIYDIVVGDMVLLQSGDLVPADGKIAGGSIQVDQSSLNGETKEVHKFFQSDKRKSEGKFIDFWNTENLYRGSVVCSGEALLCVECVGDGTVYGKLTKEAQEETRESPLTLKLRNLAKSISKFGYISAIILIVISFMQHAFLDTHFSLPAIRAYFSDVGLVFSDLVNSVIMGIIVIVVAVPEGLPLMIAIVCSLNMKKMLKAKVLVRKLVGIETSGGVNVLFTDKTGTITEGKPRVQQFFDANGETYDRFHDIPGILRRFVGLSMICNSSAKLGKDKIIGGNATEKALLGYVGKNILDKSDVEVKMMIPFRSDKKFSAAIVQDGEDYYALYKGAPEYILKNCTSSMDREGRISAMHNRTQILEQQKYFAMKSYRTLAFAMKKLSKEEALEEELPTNMAYVGMVTIHDRIRPEAKAAIADVTAAGVQVVMITGDRRETAEAIAKDAGILTKEHYRVLTSQDLQSLQDAEIKAILPEIAVISRALPSDKSRLVRLAQELNLVVGMTGDGVNDAPALKAADVGFAMGSGAEVAKEAGDIVILDDNFKSIKNAVLYGRTIYKSIKKFIQFQLTINVAAVTVSILGPIVGVEKPLDISQMIWTNLMIDSLAAIAFGGEPALARYLKERPHLRDENIIDSTMWSSIIVDGLYICGISLLFFVSSALHDFFRYDEGEIYFYTGYFTFFIFICVFNAFNTRTDEIDLLDRLSLNKQFLVVMSCIAAAQILITYYGGSILRTAGLNMKEWALVLTLALTIFPVDLLRKLFLKQWDLHKCRQRKIS